MCAQVSVPDTAHPLTFYITPCLTCDSPCVSVSCRDSSTLSAQRGVVYQNKLQIDILIDPILYLPDSPGSSPDTALFQLHAFTLSE